MTLGTSFWRALVWLYVRRCPVTRGKRRLMEALAPRYATDELMPCSLPGGARLRADLREHVQRWIYFFGVYEEESVRWFRSALRPGMTVLDIGAHVGQYTLIASGDVGPSGRVHAFEPNPANFARLEANLALNGFAHATPHALAISDRSGEATLYVPPHDNTGESALHPCIEGMGETIVRGATLDEWAPDADLGSPPHIDVVKIDVQGFEEKVLRGAAETLQRFRPAIVCEFEERWLQCAGSSSVALKLLLSGLGYNAFRIVRGGLAPVPPDEVHAFANLVLLPGSRPAQRRSARAAAGPAQEDSARPRM